MLTQEKTVLLKLLSVQRQTKNISNLSNAKIILSVTIITILTVQPVHAYIDPGTGSLIWQAILAAFVGMMFYIKKVNLFIRSVFSKLFKK